MSNYFEDKTLDCKDCGNPFVWTRGEQDFMQKLMDEGKIQELSEPKRCQKCRIKKKQRYESR